MNRRMNGSSSGAFTRHFLALYEIVVKLVEMMGETEIHTNQGPAGARFFALR